MCSCHIIWMNELLPRWFLWGNVRLNLIQNISNVSKKNILWHFVQWTSLIFTSFHVASISVYGDINWCNVDVCRIHIIGVPIVQKCAFLLPTFYIFAVKHHVAMLSNGISITDWTRKRTTISINLSISTEHCGGLVFDVGRKSKE